MYGNIVVMVPGSGKDYPIKPGESFIIAPFAQNYKQAFKTQRGYRSNSPNGLISTV